MNILDVPRPFAFFVLFVLGCCFGSFLNVCIYRFPSKGRLWDQLRVLNSLPSGCPRCGCSIRWFDNIPVFGWLMLRGRCRQCHMPVSGRYPVVEAMTGLLFMLMYWSEVPGQLGMHAEGSGLFDRNGPQIIHGLLSAESWIHLRYLLHMAMICGLIAATFIDLDLKIIPDGCTIPVMVLALAASFALGQLFIVPLWFQDMSSASMVRSVVPEWLRPCVFQWDCTLFASRHPHLHGLAVSLVGLLVGGGIVWVVRIAGFWVLRQEAMGFGDVVLMAMIGSVIGWQPVVVVFFIAPLLAIAAAVTAWLTRRHREIPYGPWLSLATLVVLLGWKLIWPVAERLFDMGPLLFPMAILMVAALVLSLLLVQLLKRILGIPLYGMEEPAAAWTSADHLFFYNSERPDVQTCLWTRDEWPGSRAGRGLLPGHRWRNNGADGWRKN